MIRLTVTRWRPLTLQMRQRHVGADGTIIGTIDGPPHAVLRIAATAAIVGAERMLAAVRSISGDELPTGVTVEQATRELPGTVDVYPVGLFADLSDVRTAAVSALLEHGFTAAVRAALRRARYALRMRHPRRRRPVYTHRWYWHGYHAEAPTEWAAQRCGHGWTRTRARLDLEAHIAAAATPINQGGSEA